LSRLTDQPGEDVKPVWTPDGTRIIFASRRDTAGVLNMYWQPSDGTGTPQRLLESPFAQEPASWHPSGKFLAFTQITPGSTADVMILPVEGGAVSEWRFGKPVPFASTPASEAEPMFSPDGRWIAYQSDESGNNQIFVRPFPGPGGKWLASNVRGQDAAWSQARQELFYWSGPLAGADGQLFVTPFDVKGGEFVPARARLLNDTAIALRGRQRDFDVHPDGMRFAVATFQKPVATDTLNKLVAIFNFADELRRLAPARSP
jgi:serine/threonine-protein kinase